ncbi:MAG: hypothetical protein KAI62_08845 [Actinomycetia bacterium]|nr:hypothetical protein [Actinomycetes bacterium]
MIGTSSNYELLEEKLKFEEAEISLLFLYSGEDCDFKFYFIEGMDHEYL